jgi:predicted dehydrogenase
MDIEREEFYRRELDLVISTSYGPGRYDYNFEHKNLDYPFPYVRWTENRNMKEYLQLLSENKINLDNIIGTIYKIEDAPEAYKALVGGKEKPLLTLLEYDREAKPAQKMIKKSFKPVSGKIKTGIIGAGNFTKSIHLPNLSKLGDLFSIHAVCSKTGSNADSLAGQYGAKYSTTDYKDVLKDKDIDLVFISTRHDLHAKMAAEAAEAEKAVFLEKPAALDPSGLNSLVKAVESKKTPLLVGFNRRFSPFSLKIKETISSRTNPLMIYYRVNAGFIPKDSWVHSGEGGGRNIGEACHFYDLFNYFTGSTVESIKASGIAPGTEQYNSNDNFTAAIKYKDGSVCSLLYTALGNESIPKEKIEIYYDQKILILEDFLTLDIYDPEKSGMRSRVQDKGLLNELIEFGKSIKEGDGYPIPLWQIIQATEISFEVEKQIRM